MTAYSVFTIGKNIIVLRFDNIEFNSIRPQHEYRSNLFAMK